MVAGIVRSVGLRELTQAKLFGLGIGLAPTLDKCQLMANHAREALTHFEIVSAFYAESHGSSLHSAVRTQVTQASTPADWCALLVAGLFIGRVSQQELQILQSGADAQLAALADNLLTDEVEYIQSIERTLTELCQRGQVDCGVLAGHVDHWLPWALDQFTPDAQSGICCESAPHFAPGARKIARDHFIEQFMPTLHTWGIEVALNFSLNR